MDTEVVGDGCVTGEEVVGVEQHFGPHQSSLNTLIISGSVQKLMQKIIVKLYVTASKRKMTATQIVAYFVCLTSLSL